MTADLELKLAAGSTSTAGVSAFMTIAADTQIENAIAGDGDDRVVGNGAANVIYGMRGDDVIHPIDDHCVHGAHVTHGLRDLYACEGFPCGPECRLITLSFVAGRVCHSLGQVQDGALHSSAHLPRKTPSFWGMKYQ